MAVLLAPRMRRWLAHWLWVAVLWLPAAADGASRDQLIRDIEAALSTPTLRGGVQAVIVQSLNDGSVWYERNPDLLLLPASNQKLITTAAALCLLGPEYRFETRLVAQAKRVRGGVINGDLYLVGGGDPFLDEAGLDNLVQQIRGAGIREVTGRLVGDGSCFPPPAYGYGWSWDDMSYYYSAPISGLNFNQNVAVVTALPGAKVGARALVRLEPASAPLRVVNQVVTAPSGNADSLDVERDLGQDLVRVRGKVAARSGSTPGSRARVTVPDPALYAARRLREKLRLAGVTVRGPATTGRQPDTDTITLASTTSPPLSLLIERVNKPSDNLAAECLLRTIGRVKGGAGTVATGREAILSWLKSIGAKEEGIVLRDGSGLSRMNFVTAETLRVVLTHMASSPHKDAWLQSLPIAGVDGTLRNRMKDTAAQGNCRAKTGYVSNVSSLSGYVTTKSGTPLAFVILMNNHACRNADATAVQDKLVVALAEYDGT